MEEGSTLDFKREQYRLNKAPAGKGELLKDILAFANTQRHSAAYILVGVQEVRGGRSEVTGVEDHLDDANLHQFVNSKTNRPVEFSYSTYTIEGKSIGVIEIPVQGRPVWARKSCGIVRAKEVYVRDGSSTRQVSPDEIAEMGRGNPPKLQVEWGDALKPIIYPSGYVHRSTGLRLPDQFQTWYGRGGHYDFEALARKLGEDPAVYDGPTLTSHRKRIPASSPSWSTYHGKKRRFKLPQAETGLRLSWKSAIFALENMFGQDGASSSRQRKPGH